MALSGGVSLGVGLGEASPTLAEPLVTFVGRWPESNTLSPLVRTVPRLLSAAAAVAVFLLASAKSRSNIVS